MILAIDLGGTKIQYALYDGDTPHLSETFSTETDFRSQLLKLTNQLLTEHTIDAIAIGVPGPTRQNIMQGSKPLGVTEDIDFEKLLSGADTPLVVSNDLDMAVLCELHHGAGLVHKNFCLVSMSTGIGVSVVNNGKVLQGRIEMGHMILESDFTPRQPCTNHDNCWASLASGDGIVARFGSGQHTTTATIFEHVLTDKDIAGLKRLNAQAFGTLVNAYDPEAIVIMGSLGLRQFDAIIPEPADIEPFTINRPAPAVVKTDFPDDIGIRGALSAAKSMLKQQANHND
jgi:predicted NBD/HSP70 family sugar kinase